MSSSNFVIGNDNASLDAGRAADLAEGDWSDLYPVAAIYPIGSPNGIPSSQVEPGSNDFNDIILDPNVAGLHGQAAFGLETGPNGALYSGAVAGAWGFDAATRSWVQETAPGRYAWATSAPGSAQNSNDPGAVVNSNTRQLKARIAKLTGYKF